MNKRKQILNKNKNSKNINRFNNIINSDDSNDDS